MNKSKYLVILAAFFTVSNSYSYNDKIIAVIDGEPITSSDLRVFSYPKTLNTYNKDLLKSLIEERIFLNYFNSEGLKLNKNLVKDKVSKIAEINNMSLFQLQDRSDFYLIENAIINEMKVNIARNHILETLKNSISNEEVEKYKIDNKFKERFTEEIKFLQVAKKFLENADGSVNSSDDSIIDFLGKFIKESKENLGFFEQHANKISQDKDFTDISQINWIDISSLPKEIFFQINDIKNPPYSDIFYFNNAYRVIKLIDRRKTSTTNIEVRKLIFSSNKDKFIENWLANKKKSLYIEYL